MLVRHWALAITHSLIKSAEQLQEAGTAMGPTGQMGKLRLREVDVTCQRQVTEQIGDESGPDLRSPDPHFRALLKFVLNHAASQSQHIIVL